MSKGDTDEAIRQGKRACIKSKGNQYAPKLFPGPARPQGDPADVPANRPPSHKPREPVE